MFHLDILSSANNITNPKGNQTPTYDLNCKIIIIHFIYGALFMIFKETLQELNHKQHIENIKTLFLRWVLSHCFEHRQVGAVSDEFQREGVAMEKALLPQMSWFWVVETGSLHQRSGGCGCNVVVEQVAAVAGGLVMEGVLWVRETLYWIICGTGSQCNLWRTGVMWFQWAYGQQSTGYIGVWMMC